MFTVCEREFDSKELTMHIGRCKTVAELADIVTENGGRLNEIHLSALWGGLAWMRAQRGGAEDAGVRVYLVLLTREQVPNISARNTANILHAMAKLHLKGEQSENLADLLVRRAMETVSDLRCATPPGRLTTPPAPPSNRSDTYVPLRICSESAYAEEDNPLRISTSRLSTSPERLLK